MNQDGDIVFDSLPYIDGDLNIDEAQKLINAELKFVQKPEIQEFKPFETNEKLREEFERAGRKEKTNAIDTEKFKMLPSKTDDGWKSAVDNAKAQLEYQLQRSVNLELLGDDGVNQWKLANWELEEMTKAMQTKVEELEEAIEAINKQRKQDQLQTQKSLAQMKLKQQDLISRIIQVRQANTKLESEIHKATEK